jgi:NAD-reducing hydrogenase large subunit
MTKTILIDPVTRIEGHSKITIQLDEHGEVADARFHVTQFRGFEKLSQGRPFDEMPALMARICGICPVSHLVASAKTCDALLGVRIPKAGADLRRIINLAQIIQSHALSFFHLSSPDLLLGMDADPAKRHVFGVYEENPQLARDGIRIRQFGQEVIERLGGKRIHPGWIVPGGVAQPLSVAIRDQILKEIPEALEMTLRTLEWYKASFAAFKAEIDTFANFPSLFMALANAEDTLEHYDGSLRFIDADGKLLADEPRLERYGELIGEYVEPDSYLKSAYFKPLGYAQGMYRVGPLARLNMVKRSGTPKADAALAEYRSLLGEGPLLSSFHYHYARLIEILYGIEKTEQLLTQPEILSRHVRAYAKPNAFEGVGLSEAPRGTLLHHYKIDENGLIAWANLVIATGNNNLAMNAGVKQVAQAFIKGDKISDGALNRVEAVIRSYDPCLSCSTHALGQMPLVLELHSADGETLDVVQRA